MAPMLKKCTEPPASRGLRAIHEATPYQPAGSASTHGLASQTLSNGDPSGFTSVNLICFPSNDQRAVTVSGPSLTSIRSPDVVYRPLNPTSPPGSTIVRNSPSTTMANVPAAVVAS